MTARHFCFTINNWTQEEYEQIINTQSDRMRYLIVGKEVGEKGTPHLQGYMEVNRSIRFSTIVKMPGFARAHLEVKKATREEARDYCKKEGKWTEIGEWISGGQGARTDLQKIMKMIREDAPTRDVMEAIPGCVSKHLRFCEKYKAIVERDQTREFRKVEVFVYHGDAGTGKSRKASEEAPRAFRVNPDESFPFEGYDGEKEIIIDDFYGGKMKYSHLLNILDGHQLRVNVKGSHRYARWTRVYITSNSPPDAWYTCGLTPALERRLTTVTMFCHEVPGNSRAGTLDL